MKSVKAQIIDSLDWFLAKLKSVFTQKSEIVNNCVSTSTNVPLAAAQGKALSDSITALNSNLSQQINALNSNLAEKASANHNHNDKYLLLTGGTINGAINIGGNNLKLWSDNEGGNIKIASPNNVQWEIDAFDDNLRIFNYASNYPGITITKNGDIRDFYGNVLRNKVTLQKTNYYTLGNKSGITCHVWAIYPTVTVELDGGITQSIAAWNAMTIGTLPASIRPPMDLIFPIANQAGGYYGLTVFIGNNGQVQVANRSNQNFAISGAEIFTVCTYCCST